MSQPNGVPSLDAGLLSPVRAGTKVEALSDDRAWLQAMLDAEVALVRAQTQVGTVPAGVAEVVASVADADAFDLVALAVRARGAANPVVAVVEHLTALVRAVDEGAAEHVHRGSTSQDILDTGAMLVAARCVEVVLADLDRVAAAVAGLARTHRDTPMAGRTLGVHAVPVTFGLKGATWLDAVEQSRSGLQRVLTSGMPVQVGGAAGTLAGYLEAADADGPGDYAERLIDAFARELGRPAPTVPWHTVRIPVLDLAAALVVVTTTLGKIAVDVRSLSRSEVAEVAEPAATGRGVSSAMPHKRNPVLATLIISAAMQAPGLLTTLGQSMLAEDERPAGAWHAEWQPLRECLRLAGGAAETAVELVQGLTVDPQRMRHNLDLTGMISSERLAVRLAAVVGKATAKRLVGDASRAAAASGRSLADELAGAPELAGRVDAAALGELLDPTHYLGAAGSLVDRALRRYDDRTG